MVQMIVLLGARVAADGSPSRAMRRRIDGAARLAQAQPGAVVFCSGAAFGPHVSEARVMAEELVAQGVARERIVLDEDSRDTLQNAVAAVRHGGANGMHELAICTCSFHGPRARMIFQLLGAPAKLAVAPAGPGEMGWPDWLKMVGREALAIPYDFVCALVRRRRLSS